MNCRSSIRSEMVRAIKESKLDVPVYLSRIAALTNLEFPCIVVSIDSESSEPCDASRMELRKTAHISVEVLVNAEEEEGITLLDNFTALIEEFIQRSNRIKIIFDYCELKNTELTSAREGDLELAVARMQLEAHYFVNVEDSLEQMADFSGPHLTLKNHLGATS